MPIDPRIALGGQPVQVQNPLEMLQTVAQIQGVREQTEARRLAADEARQKAKDAAAIQQVLAETGGDMTLALPRLRQIAPAAALKFETEIETAKKEKALAAKGDIDARVAGVNFGANIASLAVQNPARIPALRQYLQGVSAEVAPILPDTDDPAEWQDFHNLLLTGKERIELAQKNLEHFLKGEYHQALGGSLSAARNAEEWDRGVKTYLELGGPQVVADEFGAYSPENVTRAGQLTMTPAKRTELAGQEAGRTQTAAHQGVLEEQAAERIRLMRQRNAQAADAAAQGGNWTPRQIATFNQIAGAMDRSPLVRAADRTLVLKDAIAQIRKDPGNAVNQMALAYGFIQIADTYQSAVREGELGNITALATRLQQLQIEANRIYNTGAFMPPALAQQIATTSEQMIKAIDLGRQQKIREFGSRAQVSGVGEMWDAFIAGAGLGIQDEEEGAPPPGAPAVVRPPTTGGTRRPPGPNPFVKK